MISIYGRKQLSVRLPDDDLERIHKLAKENNISTAEQARRYIIKGMSVDAYQNDEGKILVNMQESLKAVLEPEINRIVKISVKNSIASSINLLYTAFLVYRIASPESQAKLEPIMDEARRLGISFVQLGKGSIDDFVKTSIQKIEATWEDTK